MKKEFKQIFEKYKQKEGLFGIIFLKKEALTKDLNIGHREIEILKHSNNKLKQQYKAIVEYSTELKSIIKELQDARQ
jgi:hypothetical protein